MAALHISQIVKSLLPPANFAPRVDGLGVYADTFLTVGPPGSIQLRLNSQRNRLGPSLAAGD